MLSTLTQTGNVARNEYYTRGIGLYDKGLYTEAIVEFERVLKTVPGKDAPERKLASYYMGESYANLGLAHLHMRMFQRAEGELKFALMLHPEYADLNLHLGVVYYKQGKLEDASLSLQKALSINPKYSKAMMYLGLSKLSMHDVSGIDWIRQAAEVQPTYRDARYQRAMVMWEAAENHNAFLLLEDLAETDVDATARLIEKALELLRDSMYAEAADVLNEAIDMHPYYADLRNYLGQSYVGQSLMDLAIGQFQKALDINPSFVGARINLASAYEQRGRAIEAAAELRHVLTICPGNIEAEERLGRLQPGA